jgi:hypothetical protein
MPTPTYTPLGNVTLGSTTSSVTFSNIPSTYRDLILVYSGTTTTISGVIARVNSDSGSNYSLVRMFGASSGANSSSTTTDYLPVVYTGNPVTGISVLQIMDYSATNKHKTALTRAGGIQYDVTEALSSRWANTAAITTLQIVSLNFVAGSTFNLYGIVA